jgi:uncharacterized protein (DUF2164 family)
MAGASPFPKVSKEQRLELVRQLQTYFRDELDQDLGDLAAGLLLDFLGPKIGAFYYNQALTDARKVVAERAQTIDEELFALETPPERR